MKHDVKAFTHFDFNIKRSSENPNLRFSDDLFTSYPDLTFFGQFGDFYPLNALPVFFNDLETPAVEVGKVADIGNALQLFHNQSRDGVEVGIFFLRREVQLRGEVDVFKRTVHGQTFIGIFLDSGFFLAFKKTPMKA